MTAANTRLRLVFLALIPRPLRSLPWLRHFYWQQDEIDDIRRVATERRRLFGWDDE